MHEHGLMEKLLRVADEEARARGGRLCGVHVRLGALASTDPDHFRGDFEHVREELGMSPIALTIDVEPDHPSGVEILTIEIGRLRV